MKDVVIVGAGGFGRETALLIAQMQSWNLLGFYDDGVQKGTLVQEQSVLGNIAALSKVTTQLGVVIAIADSATRQRVSESLTNKNLVFPVVVHPAAMLGHLANKLGKGCIITSGVILTTGITLGDFVIVNLATTIGHDTHVADFTSIMPQCSISGNVNIGKSCMIGSGARILQGITIGNNSIIGSGAVVTKSFGKNSKLLGIPAINK